MSDLSYLVKIYDVCKDVAKEQHKGQMYGQLDYFGGHVHKVVSKVDSMNRDLPQHEITFLKCVAVLHDVVEDCCTVEYLDEELIPYRIIRSVMKLTKTKEQTLEKYIEEVKSCKYATLVKIADALCNLEESFKSDEQRRINKYLKTLELLAN